MLSPVLREKLALLVAQNKLCEYCIAAHTFRGLKVGIEQEEFEANRRARSADPATEAVLRFALEIMEKYGAVSEESLRSVRNAGFGDDTIGEIVAHIALNTFSNLFNHVARPELDFPRIESRLDV